MFERVGQPRVELHLLSIGSAHKVRLSGLQTFRGGKADKVFGRFNLVFEMVVLRFDMRDRFGRGMRNAVANECRFGIADIIDEIIDGLFQ